MSETRRTVLEKRIYRILRLLFTVLAIVLISRAFSLRVVFDIEDPQLLNAVAATTRHVERELNGIFGYNPRVKVTITLGSRASSRLGFVQMGRGEYTIVISKAEAFYRTLRHEMTHVYLDAWAQRNGVYVPLWVHEGFANWFEAAAGYRTMDLLFYGWSPIDPLKFQTYPEGDRLVSYYVYVTDLFFALDARIGFKTHMIELLDLVKRKGSWEEAFSQMLGEDFEAFHRSWLLRASLMGLAGWAMRWSIWLAVPLLVGILVFRMRRLRKRDYDVSPEELEELERAFGKRYWERGDR